MTAITSHEIPDQPPFTDSMEPSIQVPIGTFFDEIPDVNAANRLIIRGDEGQRKLLEITTDSEVILFVLEEVGFIPKLPVPSVKAKNESLEEWTTREKDNLDLKTKNIAARKLAVDLVKEMAKYYHTEFWANFQKGEGLDIDKLAELHDRTDEYVSESQIYELIETIKLQNPQNQHITDALRVVLLLLLNDREDIDTPLP